MKLMRPASWLVSLALHVAVVAVVGYAADIFPGMYDMEQVVYSVDIVPEPEKPEPEPMAEQEKAPPEPEPEPEPEAERQPSGPKEPVERPAQPPPEPEPGKRPPEPAQAAEGPAPPAPAAEPVQPGAVRIAGENGTVRVSKEELNRRLARWARGARITVQRPGARPAEEATPRSQNAAAEQEKGDLSRMMAQQRTVRTPRGERNATRVIGTYGFATFADTFALERAAGPAFTEKDYLGHYELFAGGLLSVVDGGGKIGPLLYVHGGDELHELSHSSGKIYTYGPEIGEPEPVQGSVTFMPKREGDEEVEKYKTGHLFWLPSEPPMRYAKKLLLRVEEMKTPVLGDTLDGALVRLPGEPRPTVIWQAGARCVATGEARAFAAALAVFGLDVFYYSPRGCDNAADSSEAAAPALAGDLLAAVKMLRRERNPPAIGVWGEGEGGAGIALEAAARDPGLAFAALSLEAGKGDSAPEISRKELARAGCPLLVLAAGGGPDHWSVLVERSARAEGVVELLLPARDASGERVLLNHLPLGKAERAAPVLLRFAGEER